MLVGGTGFFLRALTEPIFTEPELDESRRERLRAYLGAQDSERLARWVAELDPPRAAVAVGGGPHRMGRTLEVALLSGVPLSRWHAESPPEADGLPGVVTVLDLPPEEVRRRIDARVPALVARGWVEEVRGLLEAGYGDDDPGMTGHGYREIAAHVRGETSLEEAMEAIRSATRRYARRQRTWFRNQLPPAAVRIDGMASLTEKVDAVVEAWVAAGGRPPARARPAEGEPT